MNRKLGTRILIVVVGGLWAYNIYRTIENYQVKEETKQANNNRMSPYIPQQFNKDTFELDLPSLDPFLKKQTISYSSAFTSNNNPQQSNTNQPKVNQPEKKPVTQSWPNVEYYGFLMKHSEQHQLCMLKIGTSMYRLSPGDEQQNVKIITAHTDSIQLSFNGEFKTVLKK